MAIEDYTYPDIQPTDYVDESREKILARDDAAKCGFRRVKSFPSGVTENDIGMTIYLVGQGDFKLVSVDPEPTWRQINKINGTAVTAEEVANAYQPLNVILTSLSKTPGTANTLPYFANTNDLQLTALSSTVRSMLAVAGISDLRKFLQLGSIATLDTPLNGNYIKDGTLSLDKFDSDSKRGIGFSTGDVKISFKTTADPGWVMLDDGTVGSAASGASHAGTLSDGTSLQNLFNFLWNIPSLPIYNSIGQNATKTSANSDWNANKRMALPRTLGRALAIAGQGTGLTIRNLGSSVGEESHKLTIDELPVHNHQSTNSSAVGYARSGGGSGPFGVSRNDVTSGNTGGGKAHNNMQPTFFVNAFIKA